MGVRERAFQARTKRAQVRNSVSENGHDGDGWKIRRVYEGGGGGFGDLIFRKGER